MTDFNPAYITALVAFLGAVVAIASTVFSRPNFRQVEKMIKDCSHGALLEQKQTMFEKEIVEIKADLLRLESKIDELLARKG